MPRTGIEFCCPVCRRIFDAPENLPTYCPRCETALSLLKSILLDSEHSYRKGCESMRSGDYASACILFEHSYQLWHTGKFHRAVFFSRLVMNLHNLR